MLTKSKIKKAGQDISNLPVDDPRYQEALQVFTVPPENIFGNFKRNGYYLLQLDAEKKTITAVHFDKVDVDKAEWLYVEMEKRYIDDPNMAVVLVSASRMKKILAGISKLHPEH